MDTNTHGKCWPQQAARERVQLLPRINEDQSAVCCAGTAQLPKSDAGTVCFHKPQGHWSWMFKINKLSREWEWLAVLSSCLCLMLQWYLLKLACQPATHLNWTFTLSWSPSYKPNPLAARLTELNSYDKQQLAFLMLHRHNLYHIMFRTWKWTELFIRIMKQQ